MQVRGGVGEGKGERRDAREEGVGSREGIEEREKERTKKGQREERALDGRQRLRCVVPRQPRSR